MPLKQFQKLPHFRSIYCKFITASYIKKFRLQQHKTKLSHWLGKIRAVHFAETFREKSWSVQLRLAIRNVKFAVRCSVSSCTFLHPGSRTDKLSLSNESYIFGRSSSLPDWLTPCSTILHEKQTVPQTVNKFPTIHYCAHQTPVTGPHPRPDQSNPTPFYFLNIRFKIILPPKPMSSNCLFPSSSSTEVVPASLCYSAIRPFARQALVASAQPKLHQLCYQAIYVPDGSHRVLPA